VALPGTITLRPSFCFPVQFPFLLCETEHPIPSYFFVKKKKERKEAICIVLGQQPDSVALYILVVHQPESSLGSADPTRTTTLLFLRSIHAAMPLLTSFQMEI
jgi:hypothetical protein